jgi:hypothetical protein
LLPHIIRLTSGIFSLKYHSHHPITLFCSFKAGDGLLQVGGPVPRRQVLVGVAQVVLGRGPVLGEVLLGVDAQGGGVAGDGTMDVFRTVAQSGFLGFVS